MSYGMGIGKQCYTRARLGTETARLVCLVRRLVRVLAETDHPTEDSYTP